MCMQLKRVYSKRYNPLTKPSSIILIILKVQSNKCMCTSLCPNFMAKSSRSLNLLRAASQMGPSELRALRRNGLGLKISHGHGWGSKGITTRNIKSLFLMAFAYGALCFQ